MDFSSFLGAVGKAAEVAGDLGGKAYNLAKGVRVPGGIKNAAEKAYETAKGLKLAVPGTLSTNAVNAARRLTQKVKNGVNPQAIANSASRVASSIAAAAQGAGDKMAQLGSAIQSSSLLNRTRKAWNSTAGVRGAAGNWFKGVGARAGTALQGLGQGLMARSPYAGANPFYQRTVLDDVMNKRVPGSLASSFSAAPFGYAAPQTPGYYPPPVMPVPVPVPVANTTANNNAEPAPQNSAHEDLLDTYETLERARGKASRRYNLNANAKASAVGEANKKVVDFINNIPEASISKKGSQTFLSIAAMEGSTVGIEALCKRGADPNNINSDGESLSSMANTWGVKLFKEGEERNKFMAAVGSCKPVAGGRRKGRRGTKRRKSYSLKRRR